MKKALVSVFALAALAACAPYYDYYKGGVQYTQDGADCIYYAGEQGRHYSNEIDGLNSNKKIVYRNTRCEDLYNRDMAGVTSNSERPVFAPAATSTCPVATTCSACSAQPVIRRRYIIVPAM